MGGEMENGLYKVEKNGLSILLRRTQAGPGTSVKQEQEQISPNHVSFTFVRMPVCVLT